MKTLKSASFDLKWVVIGIISWLILWGYYIGFTFWTHGNGYSYAWTCFFMMFAIMIILGVGSLLSQNMMVGSRLHQLIGTNLVFLLFLGALAGLSIDEYTQWLNIGFVFPIIVMEIVALIVTTYFLCYWFPIAMMTEPFW